MEKRVHLVPAGPAVAVGQAGVLASWLRLNDAILLELQQAELRVPGPGSGTETTQSWSPASSRELLTL